jgi:hypothetical protein
MSYVEYLRIRTPITVMLAIWTIAVNVTVVVVNRFAGTGRIDQWSFSDSYQLGTIVALGWATALGSSLWLERDGHLPIAWTKPDSRLRYASKIIFVDLVAIFGIFVIATLLAQSTAYLSGALRAEAIDGGALLGAARLLLVAIAWYSLMQALTAGLRANAGVILGPAWAVAVSLCVAAFRVKPTLWHDVFVAINSVNPLAYGATVWFSSNGVATEAGLRLTEAGLASAEAIAVLLVLSVAALATAVSRWSLVEA